MKVSNSILSLLTLSLCHGGLLNDVSNLLFGDVDAVINNEDLNTGLTGTDYIEFLHSSLGTQLGDIPEGAREAWEAVVNEVPNGANLLLENIKSQVNLLKSSNSHKSKPKKAIDYSALPENKWLYTVQDKKFPDHGLRIKSPSSLGADNVTQYSGYLDAEEKHFFFWFFESRSDPENDPVVLWLNGGPGCSSMTGLFFELGPSSVDANLKLVRNDYSWNEKANVIFLDQPVNVGFSHSDEGVSDTVTAGKDVYAFLELFFKQFPEYNNLDFHIAGESYAGHYIPVFASEIMSHNDRNFNLTSVLIGNGLTDPLRQYDYYEPMACGKGGHEAVLDEETCQGMLDKQPRCNSLIESCYESQSAWSCVPATIYCNNVAIGPYQQTGLNVYDIREPCADSSSGLCYPELEYIGKYLNQEHVREALGAEVDNFQECNFDINRNFVFTGDWMKPYYTAVSELLTKDIPVLIYAGDKDYICNWLGNEGWSRVLEWAGKDTFGETKLSPWMLGKSEVGEVRNYEHFTFLRVYEAGHMVPFNQPEASLEMLNRWIAGDYTYSS